MPVSELVVGLKCGGSDGFSGLTANPLVGRFSDGLVARGGSTVLTEVPEMFGAETLLMKRCRTRAVFERCVAMVNGFKDYYARHGQVCYENPSPATRRAASRPWRTSRSAACRRAARRRWRTSSPTAGASARTGSRSCRPRQRPRRRDRARGGGLPPRPLHDGARDALRHGGPHAQGRHQHGACGGEAALIDWDAMANPDAEAFAAKVFAVASGEPACNEVHGDRGIAIFKDGVTL